MIQMSGESFSGFFFVGFDFVTWSVYCERDEKQDHLEDQRAEPQSKRPECAVDERAVPLSGRTDLVGERDVYLLQRNIGRSEVSVEPSAFR
jgi:hypothetical protein